MATTVHALLRWAFRIVIGGALAILLLSGLIALVAEVQYEQSEVYWADFWRAILIGAGMLAFSEAFLWVVAKLALDDALRPGQQD